MEKLIFVLIFAIAAASGQQYLIQVEKYDSERPLESELRCSGAYFNATDVVIPASCIDGLTQPQIRVRMVRRTSDTTVSTTMQSITGFKVHPKYDQNNPDRNNIAVVKVSEDFFIFKFLKKDLKKIEFLKYVNNILKFLKYVNNILKCFMKLNII
jgi:hypothetical protein